MPHSDPDIRAGQDRSPERLPRFYKPELDVLRFVAFLSVFIYHASLFRHLTALEFAIAYSGVFGMCLFFVLSAYLITNLLLLEQVRTASIDIKSFYVRRVFRIWPLYFTFIAFCFFLGLVHSPWNVGAGVLVSFAALGGNWYLIYHPFAGPVMPLWSISLEEQFYLLWPALAKYLGFRALLRLSMLLLPFSCAIIYFLSTHRSSRFEIWWNSFVQFQFFGIGALLALVLRNITPRWTPLARLGLGSLGILSWVAGALFSEQGASSTKPGAHLVISYILAGVGCVSFFLAFLGARPGRWPATLLYLGKVSYGLYVFHFLCLLIWHGVGNRLYLRFPAATRYRLLLSAAEIILAFLTTTALATASYRYLEKPFLRIKDRYAIVKSRAA